MTATSILDTLRIAADARALGRDAEADAIVAECAEAWEFRHRRTPGYWQRPTWPTAREQRLSDLRYPTANTASFGALARYVTEQVMAAYGIPDLHPDGGTGSYGLASGRALREFRDVPPWRYPPQVKCSRHGVSFAANRLCPRCVGG